MVSGCSVCCCYFFPCSYLNLLSQALNVFYYPATVTDNAKKAKQVQMTSWEEYVFHLKEQSSNIEKAAMFGLDGGIWGQTDEFKGDKEELYSLAQGFENVDSVLANGTTVERVYYNITRADDHFICGKSDDYKFIAAKTNTAVLIALYKDNFMEVFGAVERISENILAHDY